MQDVQEPYLSLPRSALQPWNRWPLPQPTPPSWLPPPSPWDVSPATLCHAVLCGCRFCVPRVLLFRLSCQQGSWLRCFALRCAVLRPLLPARLPPAWVLPPAHQPDLVLCPLAGNPPAARAAFQCPYHCTCQPIAGFPAYLPLPHACAACPPHLPMHLPARPPCLPARPRSWLINLLAACLPACFSPAAFPILPSARRVHAVTLKDVLKKDCAGTCKSYKLVPVSSEKPTDQYLCSRLEGAKRYYGTRAELCAETRPAPALP